MKKCFKDNEIDMYILGRLPEDEARVFEEHYFNCPRCFQRVAEREELVSVIKARGDEIFVRSSIAEAEKPSWVHKVLDFFTPRQWVFVSLTVLALLVIIFGFMPRQRPPAPHFVLDGEDVLRGESLTLISPMIDIKGTPASFEWKALEGAAEYKVSLYGQTLIWSATTKDSRMSLPPEVKAKLVPGQKYSWQVKAFSPQGLLVAVSSRVHFAISPASK
jgi:hypothetical protein